MCDPCPCLSCALKAVEAQAALLQRAAGPNSALQPDLQQLLSLVRTAQQHAVEVSLTAQTYNTQADELQSQVDTLQSQVDTHESQSQSARRDSSSPDLLHSSPDPVRKL